MFGFSITKLLVLGIAIFAVWQGFKYLQRRQEVQDRNRHEKVREARQETQGTPDPVEDMQRCSVCGTYFAGSSGDTCGRPDCRPQT